MIFSLSDCLSAGFLPFWRTVVLGGQLYCPRVLQRIGCDYQLGFGYILLPRSFPRRTETDQRQPWRYEGGRTATHRRYYLYWIYIYIPLYVVDIYSYGFVLGEENNGKLSSYNTPDGSGNSKSSPMRYSASIKEKWRSIFSELTWEMILLLGMMLIVYFFVTNCLSVYETITTPLTDDEVIYPSFDLPFGYISFISFIHSFIHSFIDWLIFYSLIFSLSTIYTTYLSTCLSFTTHDSSVRLGSEAERYSVDCYST